MPEIEISLGKRSYKIMIAPGALAKLGGIVAGTGKPTSVAIVSNPTIAKYYADAALDSLHSAGFEARLIIVPSGERFKTLKTVTKIYDALLEMKMDRRGVLVALGGGVIGDMVGFSAATYQRGIDFIQVPTTLLAQVDASIGGKTGVDLPQGKNLVGAFHQPRAVVIDTLTLNSLPVRELRSGLAEVVKHGIIYDREFLCFLDMHADALLSRNADAILRVITRSVEIKRDVVEQDERESGLRAILNYGHTIGHAIEVLSGYGKYRHGEASSIGMVTEAILAEIEGIAPAGMANAIAGTLVKMKLPVEMDANLSTDAIVRAIELDKKAIGGEVRFALPTQLGKCTVLVASREKIAHAIEAHRTWAGNNHEV